MRILFCNKYNYHFSGAESYMFDAMELLRSQGHEVALFAMADSRGQITPYDRHFLPNIDFKRHAGWFRDLVLAGHAIYSRDARRRIRGMIRDFRPDVAHVRNIYHHLTPSVLWELKAQGVPVLYHLNDFKVLCASYNLVSNGKACEACKGGRFWHMQQQKCYPGVGPRIALTAEAYVHKWLGTYRKCVDFFLAPSQFVRDKFVEHGWDSTKFQVLPHFQSVKAISKVSDQNAPILYFGRLSPEKGIDDLLYAIKLLPALRLVIAGAGPERRRLERLAVEMSLANVEFAGYLAGADLDRAITNSCFTVLPSHAYETFGKTILESYAHARAVIATDLGSRRELIQHGVTGLLYRAGEIEDLASAMQFLSLRPKATEEMGRAGRTLIHDHYAPMAHYAALMEVYERLAGVAGSSRHAEQNQSNESSPAPAIQRSAHPSEASNFVPLRRLTFAPAPVARNRNHAEILDRRLKVAFIGGRGVISKYSGIETYYEEVGKLLANMGHEVTAYCRTYFTPPKSEHNGIKIVRLPTVRSKHLETLLHTLLSTLHVLRGPRDIVHYHALGPALFSFIPRLAGKKTVVTVQGLDWRRAKWGQIASVVLRLGERAAITLPSSTIVVSRTLQEYYRRTSGMTSHYVPNGGALRLRHSPHTIHHGKIIPGEYILFLGRFSPEKGCHLLIEAYQRLNTEVKLVMAGASSYSDGYSRQLQSHAGNKIKILDSVSGETLDELLTNAMIFVLPSDLEGLSLALLDAMGAGLCVLSSDIAENREAIGGSGFTFRRGDVADLADRLEFLVANPAVREAAGVAAQLRIREHYQWPSIAAAIEEVYFETMGWKSPPHPAMKPVARVTPATPAEQRKTG